MRADTKQAADLGQIADACFAYLVADPEELARFMDFAGLSPDGLRKAVGSETLTHGLIDYFAQNESALLAMCANSGLAAERVMRAWHRLNPGH